LIVDELQDGHVGAIGIAPGVKATRKNYQNPFVNKILRYRSPRALPV